MASEALRAFAVRALTSLVEDYRRVFDIVDEPELDESLRRMTAGLVAYAMSPGDILPDSMGILGHLDDAILYRMLLSRVRQHAPEVAAAQAARNPDLWDPLDADLEAVREFVGDDVFQWLYDRIADFPSLVHRGRALADLDLDSEDSGWLRDELNESLVRVDIKPDAARREARKADAILPRLRQRMEASRRSR